MSGLIKKPEVNQRITKLIESAGKTKTQLAQAINVRVNTLRVWFIEGKFPLEHKQSLADFLEQPIDVIESIGFRFFGGDIPRYKFNPGQVSERNKTIAEPPRYTDNVVPLIINLAALTGTAELNSGMGINQISREEFDYLALLEWRWGRHLAPVEVGAELLKLRKERRSL